VVERARKGAPASTDRCAGICGRRGRLSRERKWCATQVGCDGGRVSLEPPGCSAMSGCRAGSVSATRVCWRLHFGGRARKYRGGWPSGGRCAGFAGTSAGARRHLCAEHHRPSRRCQAFRCRWLDVRQICALFENMASVRLDEGAFERCGVRPSRAAWV